MSQFSWRDASIALKCAEIAARYKLAAIKMVTPSKEHLEEHYKDLAQKPFFKGLVTCMN